jgi:hypothetical protein
MPRESIQQIYQLEDVDLHPPIDALALKRLEDDCGFHLPQMHQAVLRQSNGIEAYGGYIRLFGVAASQPIDLLIWNRHDWWKFSWGNRCSKYWCFGETAWGDQYAYLLESVRAGAAPEVYFMDALSMTPEVIAASFLEFWENEFIRSAKEPYDVKLVQARHEQGRLDLDSHLAYVPSLLLGGSEETSNIQKMNARSAMICNGDIALQLDSGPAGKAIKGVQPYEDELHRARLRLIWT